MNEIEISKNIRKTAKKSSMTPDEALAVIRAYDAGIKEFAGFAGISFTSIDNTSELNLKRIHDKNANRIGFSGIGTGIVCFAATFILVPTTSPDPFVLSLLGSSAVTLSGLFAAVHLEAGQWSLLHRVLAPKKYRNAKNAIAIDEKLHELKTEDFKAVEANMLYTVDNALMVLNQNLESSNKYMTYESLTSSEGGGFVLKDFAYPKKDKWDEIGNELAINNLRFATTDPMKQMA
jgi:hypothetical protein